MKDYKEEDFRRLSGVKRRTFERMIGILEEAEQKKKASGGKANILCMEDRLLMTLEYLRKYRTYFHVASSYGISESSCYRNIKWIEDTLVKHPDFRLPG
ncbi:transposase family protein, partial [Rickettsiales endosymbiont of Peranema trichophorum]|uniref:helix-turn-helix domain-containing protein n=1 Tax=Rickettsiales endosymbiont of Peranema trichophorum TaxID=2486577 RepID=UPI001023174F